MGDRDIFIEINQILSENGYDRKINSLIDLADFLNEEKDSENDVYDRIRELYDQLVMGIGMW
ncbi:MAG TPA: hypothetical protein PK033_07930 [Acetivibrio sp.]|jgi:hypothetical protein|nr:hypothetical protein [Clostridium sp.]HOQ37331.1 hypothetical protein [Acetivibrio sp.]HPT91659.1 hypothetical protein [Acetivibrio sp.]HQA57790.1 hypothetical protein [Acetivibrio sp.]